MLSSPNTSAFQKGKQRHLLGTVRQTLPERRNKLEKGNGTGLCRYPAALALSGSAQATETGSFQETPATLVIPSKSSHGKPTGPGQPKRWRPSSTGRFQPLLYLHELSYVTALKHHLWEKKNHLKPHKERNMGQHPDLISQQGRSATQVCQFWESISRAMQYLSHTFGHEHMNEVFYFFLIFKKNTLEYFLGWEL